MEQLTIIGKSIMSIGSVLSNLISPMIDGIKQSRLTNTITTRSNKLTKNLAHTIRRKTRSHKKYRGGVKRKPLRKRRKRTKR